MTILCCDTSTEIAVFALADREGNLLMSLSVRHGRELSRTFFAALDTLFQDAGLSLDRVGAFAAGVGPGSFTGVRVAVATMRTLAQVRGLPLVGVGTLECFAAWVTAGAPDETQVVPILPSRRGEVYAAVYRDGKERYPPFVASHDRLAEILDEIRDAGGIVLCGATGTLPESFARYTRVELAAPPAQALARLAARALAEGLLADPFSLNPLYVALPAISQHKKL